MPPLLFAGRHSMLADFKPCHVVFSSIGNLTSGLEELPACGIYQLDLNDALSVYLQPWADRELAPDKLLGNSLSNRIHFSEPINPIVRRINRDPIEKSTDFSSVQNYLLDEKAKSYVIDLLAILETAVKERIEAQPKKCKSCVRKYLDALDLTNEDQQKNMQCHHSNLAILFSGGLDSALLALVAAKASSSFSSPDSTIDLINVAFEQEDGSFDVPDRKTGLQAFDELTQLCPPGITFNLVLVDVTKDELRKKRDQCIRHLLYPLVTVLDDSIACAIWFAAQGRGRSSLGNLDYQTPARYFTSNHITK